MPGLAKGLQPEKRISYLHEMFKRQKYGSTIASGTQTFVLTVSFGSGRRHGKLCDGEENI